MQKKKFVWILGGVVSCLLGVVFLLLITGGIFTKADYKKPWSKQYYQSFEDVRLQLTAHGILAANAHNMQPWKIELDKDRPDTMYLYADPYRYPKETDPYARQMMVSQGTFLEYIRVAGEKLGLQTEITLFPKGEYEESNLIESMQKLPVAKIVVTKRQTKESTKEKSEAENWYPALYLPDTNRSAYQDINLTAEQIDTISNLGEEASGIWIKVYSEATEVNKLGDFALAGANKEASVSRVMKESQVIFRANEKSKNAYRYGFSVEGQGTSGGMQYLMQGLLTLFPSLNEGSGAVSNYKKASKTAIDHTSAYVLIKSKDNSRKSQIESGICYSKLVLASQALKLGIQPFSQPLEEYPEMKEIYQDIHKAYAKDGETIQMLVRIGVPTQKGVQTMRQDVKAFVIP